MAHYWAKSSLETAENKVSIAALLDFCEEQLGLWANLVDLDGSGGASSIRLRQDMEDLLFSIARKSLAQFLPQSMLKQQRFLRFLEFFCSFSADKRFVTALGRVTLVKDDTTTHLPSDVRWSWALSKARLDAASRLAMRLFSFHRSPSQTALSAARKVCPYQRCLELVSSTFECDDPLPHLKARVDSHEYFRGLLDIFAQLAGATPVARTAGGSRAWEWPTNTVGPPVPSGFVTAVLQSMHAVVKGLPRMLNQATKDLEVTLTQSAENILKMQQRCLPGPGGLEPGSLKKLGLLLYTGGAHLFNARHYRQAVRQCGNC